MDNELCYLSAASKNDGKNR